MLVASGARWALLSLAIGAFGIGVSEFAPMGLLPEMADNLGISISTAGLVVTAYALGVLLGAPIAGIASGRVAPKSLLIGLMGLFTLGNALSALSGNYEALVAARLVTSLSHACFFGIGSIVAASVVAAEGRAAAVATMFMGLTIANVGGVPLASWLGRLLGWRSVFAMIAVVGIVAAIAILAYLPNCQQEASTDPRTELRALGTPAVLFALGLTTLTSAAMFTVFTYIAPILRTETHVSTGFVTAMLVVYGLGLTLGNWIGGRAADHSVHRTLVAGSATLSLLLVLFSVAMHRPLPAGLCIFAWGVATFAMVPPLQMNVLAAAADAPRLAASTNIGAFNLGNALGAATGATVISQGWGYPAVALTAAAFAGSALLLVLARDRVASDTSDKVKVEGSIDRVRPSIQ